ncbi:MAG: glycosyltransferase [Monoglobales bacterium]
MQKNKVTVVVCVYNTEPYLRKCLDSIVTQTLEDIEIIIVNDGSPDNSIDIIREYESRDERIIVFDTENRGVSQARNTGLLNATGDYIIFVDSDDYLHPDMLRYMYDEIKSTGSDMAVCNLTRVFDGFTEEDFLPFPKERIVEATGDNFKLISDVIGDRLRLGGCVSNKLFKTELLKKSGILFEERSKIYAEDAFFYFKTLTHLKKICIIHKAYYYYYQRGDSVSYTYKADLADRCMNFIRELEAYHNNKNLKRAFATRSFLFLLEVLDNELQFHKGYKLFGAAIKNKFFRRKIVDIDTGVLSRNKKIIYFLYRLRMYFLVYILLFLSCRGRNKS